MRSLLFKVQNLKKSRGGGEWDMNNLLCMKKSNICLQFKKTEEGVQIEFPDLNNLWSMRVEQVGFVCIKRQTKWFEFSSCTDSRLFTLSFFNISVLQNSWINYPVSESQAEIALQYNW